MMKSIGVVAFLLVPQVCFGWTRFFGSNAPDWNGLRATFGSPFTAFNALPRTKSAAQEDGWVNMAPGVGCDGNSKFRGERYWKDSDLAVILLFDQNGFIAGIQTGIPSDYPNNGFDYPTPGVVNHPLVLDDDTYYVTAYFVNPATVCEGRTAYQFALEGTGTSLYIQNGTDPVRDSILIPKFQKETDLSPWTKGGCFAAMGRHYWYNLTVDMPCDPFFPVFLLYNNGKLNAFGWAFGINIVDSTWFEHPGQNVYPIFMNPVPECLYDWGQLTTMHIYLTNRPVLTNFC